MGDFKTIFICDFAEEIKNSLTIFDHIYIRCSNSLGRQCCWYCKSPLGLNDDNGLHLRFIVIGSKFSIGRKSNKFYLRFNLESWRFPRINNYYSEYCRSPFFYEDRIIGCISPCWRYFNGSYPGALVRPVPKMFGVLLLPNQGFPTLVFFSASCPIHRWI